jgi:ABC-type phosphate transport system substrate-binding protein
MPRLPRTIRRRSLHALWGGALLASLFGALSRQALAGDADFRVIVHPNNGSNSVDRGTLADFFLKKATRWNDGETVKPVDLKSDNAVRRRFSESVLKRSVVAVRSYWQQRIFSGRDVPPPEVDSDEAVMAYVARYPGAIGYVSGATKLVGVKELALR